MTRALVLACGFGALAAGCSPHEPPCTPASEAALEARYSLEVVTTCPDRETRTECVAAHPGIEAGWQSAAKEAKCLR